MITLEQAIAQLNKEVRIDEETGIGYVSIRGAARLVDVDAKNIRDLLSMKTTPEVKEPSKFAVNLIRYGFNPAVEGIKEISDLVLACIIEYYAFDARQYAGKDPRAFVWKELCGLSREEALLPPTQVKMLKSQFSLS